MHTLHLPSPSSNRRSRIAFGFTTGVALSSSAVLVGPFFAVAFFVSAEDDSDESLSSSSEESSSASSLSDSSEVLLLSLFPAFFSSVFLGFVLGLKYKTH
jgi:hypothetical protein